MRDLSSSYVREESLLRSVCAALSPICPAATYGFFYYRSHSSTCGDKLLLDLISTVGGTSLMQPRRNFNSSVSAVNTPLILQGIHCSRSQPLNSNNFNAIVPILHNASRVPLGTIDRNLGVQHIGTRTLAVTFSYRPLRRHLVQI